MTSQSKYLPIGNTVNMRNKHIYIGIKSKKNRLKAE